VADHLITKATENAAHFPPKAEKTRSFQVFPAVTKLLRFPEIVVAGEGGSSLLCEPSVKS
jgi:hypothetical protein